MIVQIINNGGVGGDQLDLLIPGGGVGDFDGCSNGEPLTPGAGNGVSLAASAVSPCSSVTRCCEQAGSLRCNWFLGWFNAAEIRISCSGGSLAAAITQRPGLLDRADRAPGSVTACVAALERRQTEPPRQGRPPNGFLSSRWWLRPGGVARLTHPK
jgi:hypothetical protein